MKILIIDDDMHKINHILFAFQADNVDISNNFFNGLKKIQSNNYDLLILDMNFPISEGGQLHKLGFNFLDELKKKKISMPTIIYSSELYDVASYKNVIDYIQYNILSDEREHINNIKSKVLSLNKCKN